jgi:hypothetical protein
LEQRKSAGNLEDINPIGKFHMVLVGTTEIGILDSFEVPME